MTHTSTDTKIEKLGTSNDASRSRRDLQDILTVEEAADLLRMNRKTLYDVIRLSHPRWAVRFGRSIRVSRSALLEEFRGSRRSDLGDKR